MFDDKAELALSYIAGAILSDGCHYHSTNGAYRISLEVKDKEYRDEFAEALDYIAPSVRKRQRNDDGRYVATGDSKDLYQYLDCVEDSFNVLATDRLKRLFLRAYYSGDGYLSKRDAWDSYTVGITTTDKQRKDELERLLTKLEYRHHTNSHESNYGHTEYSIRIGQLREVKRFMDEIGSPIPRKYVPPGDIDTSTRNGTLWSDNELRVLKTALIDWKGPLNPVVDQTREDIPDRSDRAIYQKASQLVKNAEST